MSNEEETYDEAMTRKKLGQKGKSAERVVELILSKMKSEMPEFDYDKLPDTRAAGRIMPARVSDFTLFCGGRAISLEVKEMKKGLRKGLGLRLNIKSAFPQYPRMLRRAKAGCSGFLLIHNLEMGQWLIGNVEGFPGGQKSFHTRELRDKLLLFEGKPEGLLRELLEWQSGEIRGRFFEWLS